MKNLVNRSILFVAVMAMCVACNTNEPEASVQKCTMDDIEFSYYLTDLEGNVKNTFPKGEKLIVYLGIKNNREDTIMVNSQYFGSCYDSNNQLVDEMSWYLYPDTLPVYSTVLPGSSMRDGYLFFADVPAGSYHYQYPHAYIYFDGQKDTRKEYVIPLTINFKVK